MTNIDILDKNDRERIMKMNNLNKEAVNLILDKQSNIYNKEQFNVIMNNMTFDAQRLFYYIEHSISEQQFNEFKFKLLHYIATIEDKETFDAYKDFIENLSNDILKGGN